MNYTHTVRFQTVETIPEGFEDKIQLNVDYKASTPSYLFDIGSEGVYLDELLLDLGETTVRTQVYVKEFRGQVVKALPGDFEDPVLKGWGATMVPKCMHIMGGLRPLKEVLLTLMPPMVSSELLEHRLDVFKPVMSQINYGNIAIYQNLDKFDRDKQTSMAPGRALKMMVPELLDSQLSALVDKYNTAVAPRNYTMFEGSERKDFLRAYSGPVETFQNPRTTDSRKSLANSCMQTGVFRSFEDFDVHPAEAYGSGDFTVYWVENESNEIGGRVVVYTAGSDGPQAAPIYGCSEPALDKLTMKLEEIQATTSYNASWEGAKLLAFHYGGEQYIGPYNDLGSNYTQSLDCEHLVVDSCGEISGSDHMGILGHGETCYGCGSGISEDDYYYSEYTEERYCEDCYYNEHVYCEYTNTDCHIEEAITVYNRGYNGRYTTVSASEYAALNGDGVYYCEYDEEYWDEDCMEFVRGIEESVSIRALEDSEDFYLDDETGQWYDEDSYNELLAERETNGSE